MTQQLLIDKIGTLEKWLTEHHSEDLQRPLIDADLRRLRQELHDLENPRTYERDTFDLREHNFHSEP